MSRAEVLKKQAFENVYSQIEMMIENAVEQGKLSTAIAYPFFQENNELLKYVIDRLVEDGFILRMYQDRMEIRFDE